MSKVFTAILTVLACLLSSCALNGIPSSPDKLGWNATEFKPHKPEEWEMKNGLHVLFIHDDELPMIGGSLYVRGGSLQDPPEMVGLASVTGSQIREGGIPGFAPDALDEKLDSLGAKIESSFGSEFGSISFSSLAEDFPEVSKLFAKVVREPTFDQSRLELWKRLALEGIRRRQDDPGTMAGMTFLQVLYGKDSPYARSITEQGIQRLKLDDLRAFRARYLRPDGSLLVVRGAITREQLQPQLEKLFGDWPPLKTPQPKMPEVKAPPQPGVYVLNRKFDQTTVLMGHLGPPRFTDDMYAMSIFNRIFGAGDFETVLFNEVRTKHGYAYEVEGGLAPGVSKGTFQINMGSRTDQALNAVKTALEVVDTTSRELPDEKMFNDSKLAVERSFVFKFEENDDILQRAATLRLMNYPPDFDDTYLAKMGAVTRKNILEVPQRWVKPEEFSIVLVGKHNMDEVKQALGTSRPFYEVTFDTEPHIRRVH